MSSSSLKSTADVGDNIRLTINGFKTPEAQAYLMSQSEWDEFDRIVNSPGDTAAIQCTKIAKLKPSDNSVTWDVPSAGDWYIVLQDHEFQSAQWEVIRKGK